MPPNNKKIPRLYLGILALTLSLITIFQPYNNSPPIRSDGTGYHIWVHAIKSRTLSFCNHRSLLEPLGADAARRQRVEVALALGERQRRDALEVGAAAPRVHRERGADRVALGAEGARRHRHKIAQLQKIPLSCMILSL